MAKPDETDRSAASKKTTRENTQTNLADFKPGLWSPSQGKFECLQPESESWDLVTQHWFVGQVS